MSVPSPHIAENSLSYLFLGLVPIAGIISNTIKERSLCQRIAHTTDPQLLIRLIEIKNQYKASTLGRNVLQIYLSAILLLQDHLVARVAGVFFCCVSVISSFTNAYHFYKNKKVMQELDSEGFKSELPIY